MPENIFGINKCDAIARCQSISTQTQKKKNKMNRTAAIQIVAEKNEEEIDNWFLLNTNRSDECGKNYGDRATSKRTMHSIFIIQQGTPRDWRRCGLVFHVRKFIRFENGCCSSSANQNVNWPNGLNIRWKNKKQKKTILICCDQFQLIIIIRQCRNQLTEP